MPVYEHVVHNMNRIDDLKLALRKKTKDELGGRAIMLTAPEQGEFMQQLVKLMNAKKGIEIGTFTGYSALCLCQGLPEDGTLDILEINEDFLSIGKPLLEEAGVLSKMNIKIGPANDTLD